ncbi:MAG: polymerase sigma factor [Acidobacteria bacterium]|nr:polymerase sigma factor [Acidobacteriota bacterium]
MPSPGVSDVTQLLAAWREGDQGALEHLVPLVYGELRHLAHTRMRGEPPPATLQTTALVHEAYLRLVGRQQVPWQNRAHFFAVCAEAMRCILVDAARARHTQKRGGALPVVPFDEARVLPAEPPKSLLALDEALTELSKADPRKGRVVELRYFGGLTAEETAEVLGVSVETVVRDWRLAKLWLVRALKQAGYRVRDLG